MTTDPADTPSDRHRFTELVELPPSAKLVYYVLDRAEKPLSSLEISRRTLLALRTTRYVLSELDDASCLATQPVPADARKRKYTARPVERPAGDVGTHSH